MYTMQKFDFEELQFVQQCSQYQISRIHKSNYQWWCEVGHHGLTADVS